MNGDSIIPRDPYTEELEDRIKELEQELEKANLDKDFMCGSIEAMEKKVKSLEQELERYKEATFNQADIEIMENYEKKLRTKDRELERYRAFYHQLKEHTGTWHGTLMLLKEFEGSK